ncbi:MAG TPA: hypothetical protein ENK32_04305 [Anaerolineae bacterium]|nr:hypothetical protein [Anaerolineae bacterium]
MSDIRRKAPACFGLLVAAGTLILWLVGLFYLPPTSWLAAGVMILLSLLAGYASWRERPYLLTLTALLSFFPAGYYLLGTPGLFKWIGVLNLLLFVASGGIFLVKFTNSRGLKQVVDVE